MRKIFGMTALVVLFAFACGKGDIIPEMKTFMNSFGNKTKMAESITKYSTGEIVPKALNTCNLKKPIIKKTEKKDGMIYYTAESTVTKCEKSETAVGTVRIFKIGWKDGKIVSFKWQGPKSGKVEY